MSKQKKMIIGGVVLGVVVIALAVVPRIIMAVKVFTVPGTVTHIDVEGRKAGLEFISPIDGKRAEKLAEIPPDCEITLNGAPAEMEDIRPGDSAKVTARYNRKKKLIVPLSVEVTRTAAEERPSATATAPSG
jgi:hypothetical protein